MFTNALPSELVAVVGTIDPDAYGTGDQSSDWVDMGKFEHIMAVVMAGDLGSSATLSAKLEQATTSGGTPKDVTGKTITQLTQAGSDSDKQAIINLRASELDLDNGYRFVRLTMTVGTATSDAGAILLGFSPKYGPAEGLTSVDSVKV